MTFHAFAGAEAENAGNPGSGVYTGITGNDAIIASPGAFPGAYSYSVDPVNGTPVLETYGFQSYLPDAPQFLTVMFMWRFTDTGGQFDDEVAIAELGSTTAGGAFARRLVLVTNEGLQILDKDEAEVGSAAASYVAIDTDYWMLWYADLREDANSRDILWVYRPAVTVGAATDIAFVDGGGGADTITQVAAGFLPLIAGDVITVAGSASNDGDYTVVSRIAGTITLATGTLTTEGAGASVTITTPARWDKAIDEPGHGESGIHAAGGVEGNPIEAITFGTSYGKSLPTQGGPCYYDEMAVQILNRSPNTTPIGSVTTVFKVPKANGADGDFNTGTGTNPDWNDVDEIPPDGVTTYDEGDVNGDQQSYEPNDADVDVPNPPLAIQIIGQGASTGGGGLDMKSYILENSTREYTDVWQTSGTVYRVLRDAGEVMKTYNQVNGQTITESLFNTLEVGVEIVARFAGANFRLSQIGLEYMKEGPKALPGDFPSMAVQTITGKAAGAALGSANPVIW